MAEKRAVLQADPWGFRDLEVDLLNKPPQRIKSLAKQANPKGLRRTSFETNESSLAGRGRA
jgi:hypothetical protein